MITSICGLLHFPCTLLFFYLLFLCAKKLKKNDGNSNQFVLSLVHCSIMREKDDLKHILIGESSPLCFQSEPYKSYYLPHSNEGILKSITAATLQRATSTNALNDSYKIYYGTNNGKFCTLAVQSVETETKGNMNDSWIDFSNLATNIIFQRFRQLNQVVESNQEQSHSNGLFVESEIKAHESHILCIECCPCGSMIATAGNDASLKLWRCSDKKLIASVLLPRKLMEDSTCLSWGAPTALSFHPRGICLSLGISHAPTSSGTAVLMWNIHGICEGCAKFTSQSICFVVFHNRAHIYIDL